jgi:hypothetical protein
MRPLPYRSSAEIVITTFSYRPARASALIQINAHALGRMTFSDSQTALASSVERRLLTAAFYSSLSRRRWLRASIQVLRRILSSTSMTAHWAASLKSPNPTL